MISLIVAYSKNNKVIGINNTIPWHIKEDFQHFKKTTLNHTIMMAIAIVNGLYSIMARFMYISF